NNVRVDSESIGIGFRETGVRVKTRVSVGNNLISEQRPVRAPRVRIGFLNQDADIVLRDDGVLDERTNKASLIYLVAKHDAVTTAVVDSAQHHRAQVFGKHALTGQRPESYLVVVQIDLHKVRGLARVRVHQYPWPGEVSRLQF